MKHPNCTIDIGPLKNGGPGKHVVYTRVELAIPDRITNSGVREIYKTPDWNTRKGSDQHLQFKSLGMGV